MTSSMSCKLVVILLVLTSIAFGHGLHKKHQHPLKKHDAAVKSNDIVEVKEHLTVCLEKCDNKDTDCVFGCLNLAYETYLREMKQLKAANSTTTKP
uniref:Uncharacterized protein n=1 Tax=Plectus sambesii TaxID=2011161 RepID=A0A914VAL5_9BILA